VAALLAPLRAEESRRLPAAPEPPSVAPARPAATRSGGASAPYPAAPLEAGPAAEPVVQVSIGRIEVRAAPPAGPGAPDGPKGAAVRGGYGSVTGGGRGGGR